MQNVCERAVPFLVTSFSGFAAGILDTASDVCVCVCLSFTGTSTGLVLKSPNECTAFGQKKNEMGGREWAGVHSAWFCVHFLFSADYCIVSFTFPLEKSTIQTCCIYPDVNG